MQTFLNLDSSDEKIILSSENDLVIQSLKKRVKFLLFMDLENPVKPRLQIIFLSFLKLI